MSIKTAIIRIDPDDAATLRLEIDGEVMGRERMPGAAPKLSRMAFGAGAQRVDHNYDCARDEVERAPVRR